jgi:hypothetical protein
VGVLPDGALAAKPLGTTVPRDAKDLPWLTRRSVAYLLEMQGDDGGFIDSQYDFGGRDSLPDVYMACTALAALALLEWRDLDPARCDAAIERAWTYLADESHSATDNTQERMWNHGYRMLFFTRWPRSRREGSDEGQVEASGSGETDRSAAEKGGIFAHEYPNPFVSATVLHALRAAQKAGANVNPAALKAVRRPSRRPATTKVASPTAPARVIATRRSPRAACPPATLALLSEASRIRATSSPPSKRRSSTTDSYEAVRKYDDHAPPHRIGGFFFFWNMLTRSQQEGRMKDIRKNISHSCSSEETDGIPPALGGTLIF